MYLSAKRFFWYNETELSEKVAELLPEIKNARVTAVIAEAAYWRKANQIHRWFVKNIQNDEDDCGTYTVSHDQLTELRNVCQLVLDNRHLALIHLPTQQGFFFGNINADDDYYWESLRNTVEMIDEALVQFDSSNWEFEYHSSW
jgi:hypothetical protein